MKIATIDFKTSATIWNNFKAMLDIDSKLKFDYKQAIAVQADKRKKVFSL